MILVHKECGVPDVLFISCLSSYPTECGRGINFLYLLYLSESLNLHVCHSNCTVLRSRLWGMASKRKRAIGTMPKACPHLILNNFSTKVVVSTIVLQNPTIVA